MRKSTKKTEPKFIVNIDDIEHLNDIACVFALAKQNAGVPLSDYDVMSIVDYAIDGIKPKVYIYNVECNCECPAPKRKPWYKRFWNWLTRTKN